VIGAPFLVLGVLVTLSALMGAGVAGRRRGAVVDAVLSPLHPATWAAVAAILVGFWVELFAFSALVSLLSAGASLLVVGVGFVLVGVAIEGARLVARMERARAGWADDRPLRPHPYRPYGTSLRDLVLAVFLDVARWRDVVYVLVAFPLAILEAVVMFVLWTLAVTLLAVPLWYLAGDIPSEIGRWTVDPGAVAIVAGLAGLVLTPVAATVTRGLMALHRAVVAGLLCESEQRALERRVATLETSRRAVIDEEASELRRIERDLHDGAQQRLIMLSINLGLAAERIDDDPAAARGLVEDARDQARQALAELRDLVRGIAPAILLDRGLAPALSALAGRSPIPTVVTSELPDGIRLPDAVERAAYFVVAEAVANMTKHAGASRCEIRVGRDGDRLVVEVEDDGVGGARTVPGGGLAGLVGRVEAIDGTLTVTSPDGGPTVVRAAIPSPWPAPDAVPGWAPPGPAGIETPAALPQDPR
jgi:signal transduction histidine kinase